MNLPSKKLLCVVMRNGIEVWLEDERAEKLQDVLENATGSKFIRFDGETINTADVVGVFTANRMADLTRRKNGEWQCHGGKWHMRDEKCGCVSEEEKSRVQRQLEAVKACGKCVDGFVVNFGEVVGVCSCQAGI